MWADEQNGRLWVFTFPVRDHHYSLHLLSMNGALLAIFAVFESVVDSVTGIDYARAGLPLVCAPNTTSGDSLVMQLDAQGKLVQNLTLNGSGPLGPLAIQLIHVTAHGLWGVAGRYRHWMCERSSGRERSLPVEVLRM